MDIGTGLGIGLAVIGIMGGMLGFYKIKINKGKKSHGMRSECKYIFSNTEKILNEHRGDIKHLASKFGTDLMTLSTNSVEMVDKMNDLTKTFIKNMNTTQDYMQNSEQFKRSITSEIDMLKRAMK